MIDNIELEDFQYEFDFSTYVDNYHIDNTPYLFMGYCHLHQFVLQDLFHLTNEELLLEFENKLDIGEEIICNENKFILKLNEINEEIIDFIKLCLKYYLILYTDFKIENNNVSFIRIEK